MDDFKITSVDLYKFNIKLRNPFVFPLGIIEDAENVLIRINTNKGIYGWGEASPYGPITGGTQDTNYLIGQKITKLIINKNPISIEELLNEINRVFHKDTPIKNAFDMALYDILGKEASMPLYSLLGGKERELITDYTISMQESVESTVARAKEILEEGFKSIKLKVGRENLDDVQHIKAIREFVGPDIPIRIDANQAWDFPTALVNLKEMIPYNLQYVEQPLVAWDYRNLKQLKEKVSTPICVDESLFDHYDAFKLASEGVCDIFNIKLGKSGGIHTALKINAIAEASGIKCMIGCFLDSRLGLSAAAHLASARPNIHYIDLDSAFYLEDDPILGGMQYDKKNKGIIRLPNKPGLGVEIKEEFLEDMEKSTIK